MLCMMAYLLFTKWIEAWEKLKIVDLNVDGSNEDLNFSFQTYLIFLKQILYNEEPLNYFLIPHHSDSTTTTIRLIAFFIYGYLKIRTLIVFVNLNIIKVNILVKYNSIQFVDFQTSKYPKNNKACLWIELNAWVKLENP